MEITSKEFNKLKQLDRIEFRQKAGLIREQYNFNLTSYTLKIFFITYGFIILSAIAGYSISRDFAFTILYLGRIIGFLFFILFCISIPLDIIYKIKKSAELKKLEKGYFKVENK